MKNLYRLLGQKRFGDAKDLINDIDDHSTQKLYWCVYEAKKGNYTKQLELAKEILSNDTISQTIRTSAHLQVCWASIRLGKYNQALDNLNTSKQLINSLEDPEDKQNLLSKYLNLLGSVYVDSGNLDQAIDAFNQYLQIINEKEHDLQKLASVYNNLGYANHKCGNLPNALEYYSDSLALFEELSDKDKTLVVKSNIGEIYRLQGKLRRALTYHKQVLNHKESIDDEFFIAFALRNFAGTLMEVGQYEDAQDYIEECVEIWRNLGNEQWLSLGLMTYGILLLKTGDNETVKEIVDELDRLQQEIDIPIVIRRHKLLKSLYLKTIPRMSPMAEAQNLLQDIIDNENVNFEIKFDAMIEYIDVLFKELKITSDPSVYDEAKSLLTEVEELARNNFAFGKLIDILFLKSKLAIIDLNYDKADALLTQAELLAEEKSMSKYEQRVKDVRKAIQRDMDKLNNIMEQNYNLIERAKLVELTEYMSKAHDMTKDLNFDN